jgi:hypothetical protein
MEFFRTRLLTVLRYHFPNNRPNPFVHSRLMNRSLFPKICLTLTLAAASAFAAEVPKSVKVPAGWKVTMFAAQPDVGYPTCLSTAPNGDLYVGIDENGSLDAKANRGRVVRCTDTDGDGQADKFVTLPPWIRRAASGSITRRSTSCTRHS